ncbi:MAG: hypothetical protein ABI721_05765 [Candidatus Dojkabacteria bacterium]
MKKEEFGNLIFIPAIYSAGISLAIFEAIQELHKFNNNSQFMIFSLAIFVIIIAEILVNYIIRSKAVVINMDFTDEVNEVAHLFNKIVIPLALYASIIGFGYYNLGSNVLGIVLALTFILFFILFINIRAFFQNKIDVESKTHFVYDFFKFIIFFLGADVIINFSSDSFPKLAIGLFTLSFVLELLLITRQKHILRRYYLYAFIASLVEVSACQGLILLNRLNSLQIALCLVFIFYLSLAIIQHAITRTLTRSVIIEYVLVLLIALSILLGVS